MPINIHKTAQDFEGIGRPLAERDIAEQDALYQGQEDCECKEGMFPRGSSRRQVLAALGVGAAAATMGLAGRSRAANLADDNLRTDFPVTDEPWKVQGRVSPLDTGVGSYGQPSQFETVRRMGQKAPLQSLHGTITPSGMHGERLHAGIPDIDPAKHKLIVHGMVERPMVYSRDDLVRFPSHTRVHFVECSGNSGGAAKAVGNAKTASAIHGLLGNSEWTGVKASTIMKQVGLQPGAAWVLCEAADGAVMTRSIPLDKIMDDAFISYAQNGEAIRPEQGYPMRMNLPGYEGNASVKWLRRIEVSDKPFMTREETSKYTDIITATGKAWQFTFVNEAKSVITWPSGDMQLPGAGFYEIRGLAWSGRGTIKRVEVTTDGGKTWNIAALVEPIHSMAQTRFLYPWMWDGKDTVIASRAIDETGYVQPTKMALIRERGVAYSYHYNGIQEWGVAADGSVTNVFDTLA
jgi:sulfane dehydrogenase subunit SoxC